MAIGTVRIATWMAALSATLYTYPAFAKSAGRPIDRVWQQAYFAGRPFVQDALRRWAEKDHATVEHILKGREIQIMEFPNKICVQFVLPPTSLGGVPVYCYEPGTTRLIEEYSDVE